VKSEISSNIKVECCDNDEEAGRVPKNKSTETTAEKVQGKRDTTETDEAPESEALEVSNDHEVALMKPAQDPPRNTEPIVVPPSEEQSEIEDGEEESSKHSLSMDEPSKEAEEATEEVEEATKDGEGGTKETEELTKETEELSGGVEELSEEVEELTREAEEATKEAEEIIEKAEELSKESEEPTEEVEEPTEETEVECIQNTDFPQDIKYDEKSAVGIKADLAEVGGSADVATDGVEDESSGKGSKTSVDKLEDHAVKESQDEKVAAKDEKKVQISTFDEVRFESLDDDSDLSSPDISKHSIDNTLMDLALPSPSNNQARNISHDDDGGDEGNDDFNLKSPLSARTQVTHVSGGDTDSSAELNSLGGSQERNTREIVSSTPSPEIGETAVVSRNASLIPPTGGGGDIAKIVSPQDIDKATCGCNCTIQ